MLSVSPGVKIFLYAQAADLRRGYDGLAALVQEAMGEDPLSGSLFLFLNKRANRLKLFYWDRDGYAIWMKRLESGSCRRSRAPDRKVAPKYCRILKRPSWHFWT
jgi:transposase